MATCHLPMLPLPAPGYQVPVRPDRPNNTPNAARSGRAPGPLRRRGGGMVPRRDVAPGSRNRRHEPPPAPHMAAAEREPGEHAARCREPDRRGERRPAARPVALPVLALRRSRPDRVARGAARHRRDADRRARNRLRPRTPRAACSRSPAVRRAALGASLPRAQLRPQRPGLQLGKSLRQHRHDRVRAVVEDGPADLAATARDAHRAVCRHRADGREQPRLHRHRRLPARRTRGPLRPRRPRRKRSLAFLDDPRAVGAPGRRRRRRRLVHAVGRWGGDVYWGVANPYPTGGSRALPNGRAFAGPALYTDSLVVLAGRPGGSSGTTR